MVPGCKFTAKGINIPVMGVSEVLLSLPYIKKEM